MSESNTPAGVEARLAEIRKATYTFWIDWANEQHFTIPITDPVKQVILSFGTALAATQAQRIAELEQELEYAKEQRDEWQKEANDAKPRVAELEAERDAAREEATSESEIKQDYWNLYDASDKKLTAAESQVASLREALERINKRLSVFKSSDLSPAESEGAS